MIVGGSNNSGGCGPSALPAARGATAASSALLSSAAANTSSDTSHVAATVTILASPGADARASCPPLGSFHLRHLGLGPSTLVHGAGVGSIEFKHLSAAARPYSSAATAAAAAARAPPVAQSPGGATLSEVVQAVVAGAGGVDLPPAPLGAMTAPTAAAMSGAPHATSLSVSQPLPAAGRHPDVCMVGRGDDDGALPNAPALVWRPAWLGRGATPQPPPAGGAAPALHAPRSAPLAAQHMLQGPAAHMSAQHAASGHSSATSAARQPQQSQQQRGASMGQWTIAELAPVATNSGGGSTKSAARWSRRSSFCSPSAGLLAGAPAAATPYALVVSQATPCGALRPLLAHASMPENCRNVLRLLPQVPPARCTGCSSTEPSPRGGDARGQQRPWTSSQLPAAPAGPSSGASGAGPSHASGSAQALRRPGVTGTSSALLPTGSNSHLMLPSGMLLTLHAAGATAASSSLSSQPLAFTQDASHHAPLAAAPPPPGEAEEQPLGAACAPEHDALPAPLQPRAASGSSAWRQSAGSTPQTGTPRSVLHQPPPSLLSHHTTLPHDFGTPNSGSVATGPERAGGSLPHMWLQHHLPHLHSAGAPTHSASTTSGGGTWSAMPAFPERSQRSVLVVSHWPAMGAVAASATSGTSSTASAAQVAARAGEALRGGALAFEQPRVAGLLVDHGEGAGLPPQAGFSCVEPGSEGTMNPTAFAAGGDLQHHQALSMLRGSAAWRATSSVVSSPVTTRPSLTTTAVGAPGSVERQSSTTGAATGVVGTASGSMVAGSSGRASTSMEVPLPQQAAVGPTPRSAGRRPVLPSPRNRDAYWSSAASATGEAAAPRHTSIGPRPAASPFVQQQTVCCCCLAAHAGESVLHYVSREPANREER